MTNKEYLESVAIELHRRKISFILAAMAEETESRSHCMLSIVGTRLEIHHLGYTIVKEILAGSTKEPGQGEENAKNNPYVAK